MKNCGLTTASLVVAAFSLLPLPSISLAQEESPFLLQDQGGVRVTRNLRAVKNFQATLAPAEELQAEAKAKRWVPVRRPITVPSATTLAPAEELQAEAKAKRWVPVR